MNGNADEEEQENVNVNQIVYRPPPVVETDEIAEFRKYQAEQSAILAAKLAYNELVLREIEAKFKAKFRNFWISKPQCTPRN